MSKAAAVWKRLWPVLLSCCVSVSLPAREEARPEEIIRSLCIDAIAQDPVRIDLIDSLARARQLEAFSVLSLLPELSGGLARDIERGVSLDGRHGYRIELSLRQLLWDGGRWAGGRMAGAAEIRRMQGGLLAQERSSRMACIALILETLRARETQSLREKNCEYLSLERERLLLRLEQGALLESEYEEALIATEEAFLAAQRAGVHFDNCRSLLQVMVGRPVSADIALLPVGIIPRFNRECIPDTEAWVARDPAVLDALLALEEAHIAFRLAAPEISPILYFEGGMQLTGERPPFTDVRYSAGLSVSFSGPWVHSSASSHWTSDRTGSTSAGQGFSVSSTADTGPILARRAAQTALVRAQSNFARAKTRAGLALEQALSQWDLSRRALEISARRLAWEEVRQLEAGLLFQRGQLSVGDWLSRQLSRDEARVVALDARFDALLAVLEVARYHTDLGMLMSFPARKGVAP